MSEEREDDEIITCWCGAKGTYDELFDDDGLGENCGGTGHVECHCGGDLCVCHHHGQEVECPGCDECPERDDDDMDDFYCYGDDDEREKDHARRGVTLVELLVAISIVAFLLVTVGSAIVSVTTGTALNAGANQIASSLSLAHSKAQLDASITHRAGYTAQSQAGVAGVRLIPDEKLSNLVWRKDGTLDPDQPLAYNQIVQLYTPDSYSEGRAAIHPEGFPPGFVPPPGRLVLEEAIFDESGSRLNPTSWFWNVRVGDVVKVFDRPYTVVGPLEWGPDLNPELYVNVGAPGAVSPLVRSKHPKTGKDMPSEFLYLANRVDDNNDGWIDSGWDGIDNDLDGYIDEPDEWEAEAWLGPLAQQGTPSTKAVVSRRPLPMATGGVMLPSSVVVDATTWAGYLVDDPKKPGEKIRIPEAQRSRLPVNPYTGAVDLLVDDKGLWSAPSIYARPSRPMGQDAMHFWIASREHVLSPVRAEGEARLVTIGYRTGKISVNDADPADVDGSFTRAEGEQ